MVSRAQGDGLLLGLPTPPTAQHTLRGAVIRLQAAAGSAAAPAGWAAPAAASAAAPLRHCARPAVVRLQERRLALQLRQHAEAVGQLRMRPAEPVQVGPRTRRQAVPDSGGAARLLAAPRGCCLRLATADPLRCMPATHLLQGVGPR